MKTLYFIAYTVGVLTAPPAFCATNAVFAGADLQTAINVAAPGDTLFIEPATYAGDLLINKSLRFRVAAPANGSKLDLPGSIQIQGAVDVDFQRTDVGGPIQTTGANAAFFDCNLNSTLSASGGKVVLKRTALASTFLLQNNASIDALRFTARGTVSATATTASFSSIQSSFENPVAITGFKTLLAYNRSYRDVKLTNCVSTIVQCGFEYAPGAVITGVTIHDGSVQMFNCFLYAQGAGSAESTLRLNATRGTLANNTFISNYDKPVEVIAAKGSINLRGNIFKTTILGGSGQARLSVDQQSAGYVSVNYCGFAPSTTGAAYLGLLSPPTTSLVNVEPMFVPFSGISAAVVPTFLLNILEPSSPYNHAGPPEAIFNNRDGSRNTIGHTGGPYFNPSNWTNSNPMVAFLTAPQNILKGAQATIPVSAALSAGH